MQSEEPAYACAVWLQAPAVYRGGGVLHENTTAVAESECACKHTCISNTSVGSRHDRQWEQKRREEGTDGERREEEGKRRQRGGSWERCCVNNPPKEEERGRARADGNKKKKHRKNDPVRLGSLPQARSYALPVYACLRCVWMKRVFFLRASVCLQYIHINRAPFNCVFMSDSCRYTRKGWGWVRVCRRSANCVVLSIFSFERRRRRRRRTLLWVKSVKLYLVKLE